MAAILALQKQGAPKSNTFGERGDCAELELGGVVASVIISVPTGQNI
jgi:hypothetical protein